jgi:hypothetical protein
MNLEQLKKDFDADYTAGQEVREKAFDDLVFYWVTHWDDDLISGSNLAYKGQFDVLRKAGRQIIGDLRSNEVSIDFHPKDEAREDGADFIDGLYRTDDRKNSSIEAYDYSLQEAVVSGFGAWEMCAKYKSDMTGDEKQEVDRRYIPEACSTVFWDANAKALDKSDASRCAILFAYTEDGYKDLRAELGNDEDDCPSSFADPAENCRFPWYSSDKKIYVVRYYYRKKVNDKLYLISTPYGDQVQYRHSDIKDQLDELLEAGYEIVSEKRIKRWEVRLYIASGAEILNGEDGEEIACDYIPVISTYGERAFVDGQEIYEGVTRLAKDPQRLRDFMMSYVADIVSKSPREKDIYYPEQIEGFQPMYEEPSADNNYPYLLQNRITADGQPLPLGAIAKQAPTQIPQSVMLGIELTRQAVEDVANPGLPQDIADPDLSGKAIMALQNRLDQQSIVYQQNFKTAKRYDAQCYVSFMSKLMDTPRDVTLTLPDGTRQRAKVMDVVIDKESGEPVVLNDITNQEFEVYATISRSYANRKEQTIEQIDETVVQLPPGDPMQRALILKKMTLIDGIDLQDIREYARKQLILSGFKEPESEEDQALLAQQAQQAQQPDPAMVLAEAELLKGQADNSRAEIEKFNAQQGAINNNIKSQVDIFKAQTDRINSQVNAVKVGADINYKRVDSIGKNLERSMKFRGSATA